MENAAAEIKLKPCPFCGGKAEVYEHARAAYSAFCTVCNVEAAHIKQTPEKAAEAWNKRAEID